MKTTKKTSATPKTATKKVTVHAAKPTHKPVITGTVARERPASPMLPLAPEVEAGAPYVEIATRAYFIYLNAGRPEGQEMQHWLEAEAELCRR